MVKVYTSPYFFAVAMQAMWKKTTDSAKKDFLLAMTMKYVSDEVYSDMRFRWFDVEESDFHGIGKIILPMLMEALSSGLKNENKEERIDYQIITNLSIPFSLAADKMYGNDDTESHERNKKAFEGFCSPDGPFFQGAMQSLVQCGYNPILPNKPTSFGEETLGGNPTCGSDEDGY